MPILTVQERIGTRVAGRYRIERLLARGGMSVLFEARDTRTHRSVAVKLLKTEDCVDERRVARFLQETRLTAELRDLHVVDVLDLGQEDTGAPYLVMELLHGRSLQAELDARGTLGIEEALATLLPVMAALAAVHSAGVIHRDVKPDNIFLHLDGTGKGPSEAARFRHRQAPGVDVRHVHGGGARHARLHGARAGSRGRDHGGDRCLGDGRSPVPRALRRDSVSFHHGGADFRPNWRTSPRRCCVCRIAAGVVRGRRPRPDSTGKRPLRGA